MVKMAKTGLLLYFSGLPLCTNSRTYLYLCRPAEMQIHLPHLLLPFCLVEADIKHLYPNEDNSLLLDSCRCNNGRHNIEAWLEQILVE